MPSIREFEEIQAWKIARQLTREIYAVSARGGFPRDPGLRDQIRRAAVSAMSNIAEGFERGGNREFRQFLSLAKGSAGEVRSQLYVALDAAYITEVEFTRLSELSNELGRVIAGFMRYLAASELKGNKLKESEGPEYDVE